MIVLPETVPQSVVPGGGSPSPMMLPPLNLNQSATSSAKTGDLMSTFGSDNSGFSVNFGNGVVQGGGSSPASSIPPHYWLIAAVIGYALWKKKLL